MVILAIFSPLWGGVYIGEVTHIIRQPEQRESQPRFPPPGVCLPPLSPLSPGWFGRPSFFTYLFWKELFSAAPSNISGFRYLHFSMYLACLASYMLKCKGLPPCPVPFMGAEYCLSLCCPLRCPLALSSCAVLLSLSLCVYVYPCNHLVFPSLYVLLCNPLLRSLSFSLFTASVVIRLCCPLLCRLPCLLLAAFLVISLFHALMKEFSLPALLKNFFKKISEKGLTLPFGGGILSMVAPPIGSATGKAGDHGKQKSIPSDSTGKEVMP